MFFYRNAMLRSSRYDAGTECDIHTLSLMVKTYDISDVVEQEWRDMNTTNKHDLLEGVFIRNKDGMAKNSTASFLKLGRVKPKRRGHHLYHIQVQIANSFPFDLFPRLSPLQMRQMYVHDQLHQDQLPLVLCQLRKGYLVMIEAYVLDDNPNG